MNSWQLGLHAQDVYTSKDVREGGGGGAGQYVEERLQEKARQAGEGKKANGTGETRQEV